MLQSPQPSLFSYDDYYYLESESIVPDDSNLAEAENSETHHRREMIESAHVASVRDDIDETVKTTIMTTGEDNSKEEAKDILEHRPILVLGPKNTYVVRNRPATLTCRALYAKRIRFKCNGRWVEPKDHVIKEGFDPISGLPYFESSVPIHRKEIEEYFGLDAYSCECYASASKEESAVKSDSATVKLAYLRKHFYSAPSNERKSRGAIIQFPCTPPDGEPKPEIFWLKNGVEIGRRDDSNVILANDDSLLISSARISDSGNYTCGAINLATRRLSPTAELKVFVDGGWSEWTPWSGNCAVDCDRVERKLRDGGRLREVDLPKLNRYRRCDSPEPVNGGLGCEGREQEMMNCPLKCPLDGGWSEWSEWSQCSADCHQYRNRDCADPQPQNGGRPCKGVDLVTQNCTGGFCRKDGGAAIGSSKGANSNLNISKTNLAMYAGLSAALVLFLVLLSVILWLCLRKRKCCKREKGDEFYYAGSAGHLRAVLNVPPDLTQTALLVHADGSMKTIEMVNGTTPLPEFSSFSLKSGKSGSSGGYSHRGRMAKENLRNMNILAGSKTALLENGSSTNSSHPPSIDSAEKQRCISRSSRNSEEHYATLYDFQDEQQLQQQQKRNSMISSAFPPHIEVESFSVLRVDHRGARVTIPHCGVTLTVPEGALEKRQTEEVYVAVCREASDRPKLSESETLLSPVIWCGPPGLPLRKPVIISFPHCAQLFPLDNWKISLLSNEGLPGDASQWDSLVTVGEENINTPVYCQLDLDSVHVMTDTLCRFTVIGSTRAGMPGAVKRMKLAAFAPLYPSSLDYSIRVYCVEDTDAALQGIIDEEEEQGASLVADTREFSCQEGGDLCFCLEDISPGWQVKPGANYQEIPAAHVWSSGSGSGGLHCSFSLELIEGLKDIRNLSARIVVYQRGTPNARQILQVNSSVQAERVNSRADSSVQTVVSSCGGSSSSRPSPPGIHLLQNNSQSASRGCGSPAPFSPVPVTYSPAPLSSQPTPGHPHPTFKLPIGVKRKICAALDPPLETENDWRMLARKLSVDRYIQFFGFRPSPTEHILDLWEAREASSSHSVMTQLLQTLKAMGRMDAAGPLETYLSQNPTPL